MPNPQPQMPYSFADVNATITGPGGSIQIGAGAGSAEGGISYEPLEETDRLKIGADGALAHALNPTRAFRVTVRLLKTSPQNQALQSLYNFQRSSAILWGQNVLLVSSATLGDIATFQQVAFLRVPPNTWQKEVTDLEWEFVGNGDIHLGGSLPVIPVVNLSLL